MHIVTKNIFSVFAFKVTHRVILLTRFCKLLTRVATLSGHVPQVPQWHDASGGRGSEGRKYPAVVSSGEAPVGGMGTNCHQKLEQNETLVYDC